MSNNLIQCREDGCPLFFNNPCQEVSVMLLSLETNQIQDMSEQFKNMDLKIINTLNIELMDVPNDKLKSIGIKSLGGVQLKIAQNKVVKASTRILTFECSNGHRHQYIVDCNKD